MKTHPTSRFTPLAVQLAQIIGGLRAAVAACGGRRMLGWDRRPDDPRIIPLSIPIWNRIGRLLARFERLVARLGTGWRPKAAPQPPPRATQAAAPPRAQPDAVHLPRGFGWLVQLTHGATAASGHLQALLAEPGMAELLAAAPSAGRFLRPLCQMLGIRPGPPLAEPPTAAPPQSTQPRRSNGRFCPPPPAQPHWQPLRRFSTPAR